LRRYTGVLVLVLMLLLLIPKIILKIAEALVFIVKAALTIAQNAILAAIKAIGSFGNMGRVLNRKNRVIKIKFMRWIDKLVLMRIWEITLAAKFSPTSAGFACKISMTLFSTKIDFGLSFSLDFSYIVDSFVDWVKSWVNGESDGEKDKASAAASSALGAPSALGFSPHPAFHTDQSTVHGRVYAGAYDAAKRAGVAPAARGLALAQAHSLMGRDDSDHSEGGDLGEHIRHEHERHASLVALVAAARASHHASSAASSSNTTSPSASALGAALRAAPTEVSAHIAAILGAAPVQNDDEWFAACDPKSAASDAFTTHRRHTEEAHHDVCDASSAAAAVACATKPGSTDCAYALSALRSHACSGRATEVTDHPHIATCSSQERLAAAFPTCTARCVGTMHNIGNTCGFLVPRAGHRIHPYQHDHPVEEDRCDHAVRDAHTHCAVVDSTENAACMDALGAVPGTLVAKAAEHSAKYMGGKHVLNWAESGARGVLHEGLCGLASDGHLDLRGNSLMGSVPSCMISEGSESTGNLFISRNSFSGEIGKLGAHVTNVMASDNRFSGDLGAALEHAAPEMTTLQVSGNKFDGGYSFIGRMTAVQHLDIEDNKLGGDDRHFGDSLPRMISSLGSLKHYAISGNKFAPGAMQTYAAAKTEVHVTLVLRVPAHKFCSGCAIAARMHSHECAAHGACRGEKDANIAGRLECVVAAHAPAGSVAKIERVVPHVTADGRVLSIAALTIVLPAPSSEEGAAVAAPFDANAIARHIEKNIGEGEGPVWNRPAAAAASCDQRNAFGMPYRGAEVEQVVAKAACAPGHSGDECLHFCPATWARVDEGVRSKLLSEGSQQEKPSVSPSSASLGGANFPMGAALVSVAGLGSSEEPLHSYHESLHYQYAGADSEHLPFSTALDSCTGSCRGHAALAIHSCQEWLREGKQTAKARFTCRSAITEMHSKCGSSMASNGEFCAGGKTSYTLKMDQSNEDHDCEVCGIHHSYAQHGALGGPNMYAHKVGRCRLTL